MDHASGTTSSRTGTPKIVITSKSDDMLCRFTSPLMKLVSFSVMEKPDGDFLGWSKWSWAICFRHFNVPFLNLWSATVRAFLIGGFFRTLKLLCQVNTPRRANNMMLKCILSTSTLLTTIGRWELSPYFLKRTQVEKGGIFSTNSSVSGGKSKSKHETNAA